MTATRTGVGWYVYGVVPADAAPELFTEAPGVGEAPIDLVREGDLAAIAGRVPLEEFGEQALRRNLESREWLEEKARAHDRVLAQAVAVTPLVPLRFGAVYRSEAAVHAMLRDRDGEFRAALERLRGRVELGVKAFLRDGDTPQDPAAPATGREYLLRKQRERDAEAESAAAAHDRARSVHERLAAVADDARANPPQRPELTGRRDTMLLNGAYLVTVERQAEFVATAEELRAAHERAGIELELTGPWPPYNFVREEALT